jgi:hypothetical protein
MVGKIEDVQRGDLVEIALTSNANMYLDSIEFYAADKSGKTNIPGRFRVGYFIMTELNFVSLAGGWDKPNDKPERQRTRFYFEVVESCRKL